MATGVGRTPPRALRESFVWGVAVGPTLASPPACVFSRISRYGASSDRCRATASGLAHSGHVAASPPNCNLCVYDAFSTTNKDKPRFFSRHFGSSDQLEHLAGSFKTFFFVHLLLVETYLLGVTLEGPNGAPGTLAGPRSVVSTTLGPKRAQSDRAKTRRKTLFTGVTCLIHQS
jgi:hypothetical protein